MQPKQRGTVRFDSSPHGARIIVDGQILVNPDTEEAIKTPATVLLIEGRRDFTLELEGHADVVGYVDVLAGTTVNIFRNLEPIPGSNIRSMQYGRGDIFVDSTPRGAFIYIDDIPFVGTNNIPILTPARAIGVMEGQHMVQISLDGYYSKKLIIDVIPDRLNIAYAKLQSIYLGERLSEQPGILRVYSFPDGAGIYINGRYVGRAPLVATGVPAGVATVTFKMPGMMDEEKIVDIVGGAWSDTYATMRPVLPKLSSIDYNQDNYLQYNQYNYLQSDQDNYLQHGQDNYLQSGQNSYPQYSQDNYLQSNQDSYSQYDQPISLNEVKAMNTGNVTINTNPSGAYVYVDSTLMTDDTGNPVTTPVTLSLYAGSRFIEICKEGYNIDYRVVYVYEGADIRIDSNLFPSPYYMSQIPKYAPENPNIPYYTPIVKSMEECPSATEGIVVITTYPPGATIIMDGKTLIDMDTGEPLVTPVDLAVDMGYHDLRFKLDRFFDEFAGVYVIPRYHQYLHKNFNVCGYEC